MIYHNLDEIGCMNANTLTSFFLLIQLKLNSGKNVRDFKTIIMSFDRFD